MIKDYADRLMLSIRLHRSSANIEGSAVRERGVVGVGKIAEARNLETLAEALKPMIPWDGERSLEGLRPQFSRLRRMELSDLGSSQRDSRLH